MFMFVPSMGTVVGSWWLVLCSFLASWRWCLLVGGVAACVGSDRIFQGLTVFEFDRVPVFL
jgi:hypothetical protein